VASLASSPHLFASLRYRSTLLARSNFSPLMNHPQQEWQSNWAAECLSTGSGDFRRHLPLEGVGVSARASLGGHIGRVSAAWTSAIPSCQSFLGPLFVQG
jgi:hypothetical protein